MFPWKNGLSGSSSDLAFAHATLSRAGFYRSLGARSPLGLARAAFGRHPGPWSILRYHAANTPNKPAVIEGDRVLTYAQWDAAVDALAEGLRERGVGPGVSVIIMLRSRSEFPLTQGAVARLGGIAASVYWKAPVDELRRLASHCAARVIVFEAERAAVVREAARDLEIPDDRCVAVGPAQGLPTIASISRKPRWPLMDASGRAGILMYTSGTTSGVPKGTLRTFPTGGLFPLLGVTDATRMRSDDIHLQTLPLHHGTAFGFVSMSHLLGSTVVILGDFEPRAMLRTIAAQRVTHVSSGPALLHRLVTDLSDEEIRAYDTSSLRAIYCAGTRLSVPLCKRLRELFGDILYNVYGATETGNNMVASPQELATAPGTIGRPVYGTSIWLRDEAGHEVPQGQIGEVFIESPTQLAPYFKAPELWAQVARDGVATTGDLGYRDEAGLVHILGRKSEVIATRGGPVIPVQVEQVFERHPAVCEVAIFGSKDAQGRARVTCVVVPHRGRALDEGELRRYAEAELAEHARPELVCFRDVLPRNATGKVDKLLLAAELSRLERSDRGERNGVTHQVAQGAV